MRRLHELHHPEFFGMEYTTMSMHLYRILERQGYPLKAFTPRGQDKVARSTDAANRLEQGRIYFPEHKPEWYDDVFSELFTWTGAKDQTDELDTVMLECERIAFERSNKRYDKILTAVR